MRNGERSVTTPPPGWPPRWTGCRHHRSHRLRHHRLRKRRSPRWPRPWCPSPNNCRRRCGWTRVAVIRSSGCSGSSRTPPVEPAIEHPRLTGRGPCPVLDESAVGQPQDVVAGEPRRTVGGCPSAYPAGGHQIAIDERPDLDRELQLGEHRVRVVDDRLQLWWSVNITIRPVPNEVGGDHFGRDGFARPQLVDPTLVQRLCGIHIPRLPHEGAEYATA